MRELKTIEAVVKANQSTYISLLKDCKRMCFDAAGAAGITIEEIYSREKRSSSQSEFKDDVKILRKLNSEGKTVSRENIMEIQDLVGTTSVVRYADEGEILIGELRNLAQGLSIQLSEPRRIEAKDGYYATHIIASRIRNAVNYNCEIQIKTMLHNAWSVKMHDLTYKPAGYLDPRMSALMTSVAKTIDSLEIQSALIRDMITSGWNVEADTRKLARETMLKQIGTYFAKQLAEEPALKSFDLIDRIDKDGYSLAQCNADDEQLKGLLSEVQALKSEPAKFRFAWLAIAKLAALRPHRELSELLDIIIDNWLLALEKKQIEATVEEIESVPLIFYARGDHDRAIDCSNRILEAFPAFSDDLEPRIRANLVAFRIEQAYHIMPEGRAFRENLERELRQELARLVMSPHMQQNPSALRDSEGLLEIVFAQDLEQVRKGIAICHEAAKLPSTDTDVVIESFEDLNVRLGWRRYFELEVILNGAGRIKK